MDKIKCSACAYARQDKKASVYTKKQCRKCKVWAECAVCALCEKRDACKARANQKNKQSCNRRAGNICDRQACKWEAIECGNAASEYYRSLLNVSINGDMQKRVTWSGCADGEAKASCARRHGA